MNLQKFQLGLKRFSDIILSVFFFILFIPLWIIIPVLIKIDSSGRIIYTQKRIAVSYTHLDVYKRQDIYCSMIWFMKDTNGFRRKE